MCEPLVLQGVGGAVNVFPGRGNSWVEIALCPGNGAVSKQGWCSLISAGDAELGTGSVVDKLLPRGMGAVSSCHGPVEAQGSQGQGWAVFLHGDSLGHPLHTLSQFHSAPDTQKDQEGLARKKAASSGWGES